MTDIIEDELFSSSVIKDLQVLDFDYVPDELPHREEKLRSCAQLFKPLLSGISQNAIIQGPVGTGKTVLVKKFCTSLVRIARQHGKHIEYIHINCRKRSTDGLILLTLLNHFDPRFPDRGFSVQEMLQILQKQLTKRNAQLLLVLDEADALLLKHTSNLIYSLTRFSDEIQQNTNPISVIMISQKELTPMLDTASISTFKRSNTIILTKYTRDELYDIIHQRITLAFHTDTISDDSAQLIADIASEWGDARFAIELLWKAGICADQQHVTRVIPEHIRAAKAETYSIVTESKLLNLNRHQLITLLSIAKRFKKDEKAYVTTGEVEKSYAITCEEYEEKPRGHTMFWKYLKEIEGAGFISMNLSGKGQLGTTQLISLPDIPAGVINKKIEELLQ
jgi:cell division control protein 6